MADFFQRARQGVNAARDGINAARFALIAIIVLQVATLITLLLGGAFLWARIEQLQR